MIEVENQYYNINRILLLICGLWPYENTKFRYVRVVFLCGILISFMIYQMIILFIYKYNFKLVLKISADMLPFAVCMVKFITFLFNSKKVKQLLDQIYEDWNALKNSEELEIAQKYGKFTKRLTKILFLCTLFGLLIVMLVRYIPIFINSSTTVDKFFLKQDDISDVYLDKKKYIYFFITSFVGVFVITSTITMIIAYMRHICMMFKITCYRIENSLNENILHMSISQKEKMMYQRLISAINIHRRALQFAEFTLYTFKRCYLMMIGLGVLSLAVNLLNMLQAILILDNINDLILTSFFIILHFIFFFVGNYGGQIITDHSVDILTTLYNIQWYMAPLRIQKLILFLILKNTKSYSFLIGGIYVASLEAYKYVTILLHGNLLYATIKMQYNRNDYGKLYEKILQNTKLIFRSATIVN
ncbi:uncharacterized protein LOC109610516 [Camponotus floridanus]|uniref:uncharacterized protein LOC109610516 n=1 Tax=Camponotus floridanus TaxID=104421 RepID=UPI000DC682E4|nr:uncharacterized protein LOC109610516 [Camponotus floridanus]